MKRKFDIITDSGSDLPENYLQERKIVCVKLGFTMNNVLYEGEGGEKIPERDFYQKLREGAMPTTYQVTAETAKSYMEKSLKEGRDVLVIAFSSGLSGTAGSFSVAKKQLQKAYPKRKIFVIDSLCASLGQGLLVDYVVKKADEGAEIEETAKYAEELKGKICHLFTVDNLFHLKRGGRISATTAIVGSILKIKPVMHVDDGGKLVAIGKAMGRKKSIKTLVDTLLETKDMQETDPIFISHGDCEEDVDYAVSLIKEKLPKVEIFVNFVGAVIGTHSGCGTLAVFYKGIKR